MDHSWPPIRPVPSRLPRPTAIELQESMFSDGVRVSLAG
jgi:hypothetical protein